MSLEVSAICFLVKKPLGMENGRFCAAVAGSTKLTFTSAYSLRGGQTSVVEFKVFPGDPPDENRRQEDDEGDAEDNAYDPSRGHSRPQAGFLVLHQWSCYNSRQQS